VVVPTWVGFVWMGAFGLLLVTALATDALVGLLALVLERRPEWTQVQAWAIPLVVSPVLLLGVRAARGTPRVEKLTVPIKGLGKELDGFRIVQITDIHIGETLHRRHLQRIVDQVNALSPDAVAVTGDLVDGTPRRLEHDIAPLGELKGKHGVYFVTGNHEYYHGGPAWERHVAKLGLTVLHNSHRVVEVGAAKLLIGGVPDLEAGNVLPAHAPDAQRAFAGSPQGAPRVLLAHQPRFAKRAQGLGVQLQLSGHTHGGQIFPFMFFVRLQQPVIAGFHILWGVPTYTSKGTGYWGPPVRVGTSCEVTEITLRSA
jgi:predicted MPP superfamily phosphohydrolase